MTVQDQSTQIVIDQLPAITNESRIRELVQTAGRHAAVVRELLRSEGDLRTISDLSHRLLAESLRDLVAEYLESAQLTGLELQLAELAIELVDWDKVAQSQDNNDGQSRVMAA